MIDGYFSGDPTFIEMQSSFWLEDAPLGGSIICPRDGRPGCALVDWIHCDERREQTHFLSWTWKYRLHQVTSALDVPDEDLCDPGAGGGGRKAEQIGLS